MASSLRDRSASRPRRAQDLLTCIVCAQYFEDPRRFPCGHTFCRKCLERHQSLHQRQQETRSRTSSVERRSVTLLPCPAAPDCLHVAVVPPEGVAGFPPDDRIAGLKERVVSQMAENILRRLPGGAGGSASDAMSTFSDVSCETAYSAPAGYESGGDDGDDEVPPTLGSDLGGRQGRYGSRRFDRYFDDAAGGKTSNANDETASDASAPPRYTPGVRSDRRRVGYSSSFQHRRRRVNVGSPTAFDDASPVKEFLRRQPSRCGSAPHLDDEKPTTVRGVHLREPLRRNASTFADKIRPSSAILEEMLFNSERPSEEDRRPDENSSSSYFSKYASGNSRTPRAARDDDAPSADNSSRNETNYNERYRGESAKNDYRPSSANNNVHSPPEPEIRTSSSYSGQVPRAAESATSSSQQQQPESTPRSSRSFAGSRGTAGAGDASSRYQPETETNDGRQFGRRGADPDNSSRFAETPSSNTESWSSSSSGTARSRRKLPDCPGQSYAERIKSRFRASGESGEPVYMSARSSSAQRDPFTDKPFSPAESASGRFRAGGVPFDSGSPSSQNVRGGNNDRARYESPFRSTFARETPSYNDPQNKTNANSGSRRDSSLPRPAAGPASDAYRTPMSENGGRGNGMRMNWNGNGSQLAETLWSGISKYLDVTDSSEEEDDDGGKGTAEKKDDVNGVTTADNQGENGSGISSEGGAKQPSSKGDDSADQSSTGDAKPSAAQSQADGSIPSAAVDVKENPGSSSTDGSVSDSVAKSSNGNQSGTAPIASSGDSSSSSVPSENGVAKDSGPADAGVVPNGSADPIGSGANSDPLKQTKSDRGTVINGHASPNGGGSDADKKPPGRDFDETMRAARAKYSACDAPASVVRKPVLSPLCRDGVVARWSMQRDDFAAPTAVAIASTGSVFVADGANSSLDYVDEDGNLLHSITGMKPYSVAVIVNGATERIYVGDRKSRTVRVFDTYGCDVIQWDSETTSFGWIAGIASLKNGNLVIVDRERCKVRRSFLLLWWRARACVCVHARL
jgi:hypothetical protein